MPRVRPISELFTPEDRARGRRPGAPVKLAHVVLKTAQPAAMIGWYVEVLDAQVVFENDRLAFLTYDLEHHRVAIVKMPRPLRAVGLGARYLRKLHGVDHIAFTYATLGELMATYRRLAARGIRPVWCINHGPTTSMYYEDPDGNRLELQYDNFERVEDLVAWVESGAFEENAIGVEFDPEVLGARLDAGEPLEALVQRGAAPPPGREPRAGMRAIRWKTL